jgi:hypothetical protein
MIIRSKADPHSGLAQIDAAKDKLIFTHVFNPMPTMAAAAEARKDPNQGWSKDRTRRKIASIPPLEWFKHPEWDEEIIASGDSPSMRRWLQSDYGRMFKTVDHL